MFQCPNCRAYTDLSAEVDDTNDFDDKEEKETDRDQATPEEQEGFQPEPEETQGEPEALAAGETPEPVEMPGQERDAQSDSEEPRSEQSTSRPASPEQSQSESRRETPNTSDSSEGAPAHESRQSFVPLPALPLQMDPLSSPSLEEALAINFGGLDLQNARTRTEEENPDDSNPPEATSDGNASHSDNQMQSTNPINAVHARQSHLDTDTPSRSESFLENPLTPRNDSGPLALDGRAGMQ